MHDLSDEATSLPPLQVVQPEYSVYVLQWLLGVEGIVVDSDQDVPVRYLSVRGITVDGGRPQYSQVHLAIPHHAIRPLLEQWLELLDKEDADADAGTDDGGA